MMRTGSYKVPTLLQNSTVQEDGSTLERYNKNDILLARQHWMTKHLLLVAMVLRRELYLGNEIRMQTFHSIFLNYKTLP